jgi:hypothetical protein
VLQVLPQPNMQKKERPLNIEHARTNKRIPGTHRSVDGVSRPLLTADTRGPRSGISFADPRSDRINPANRMRLVVFQKRTGCCVIFGRFDFTGISIPDKTVCFHKLRQADIKIIRSRSRIQFRPWDANLFAAVSTSFAVEGRRRHLSKHVPFSFRCHPPPNPGGQEGF